MLLPTILERACFFSLPLVLGLLFEVGLIIGETVVVGLFWLNRARLPPAVLSPNILSKGVETGPTATQFGLACAQTMPRLPGVCLQRAKLFQLSCGRQI